MRLLQRRQLHRHVVEAEVLALEAHGALGQPLHDDRQRLVVDVAGIVRIAAEQIELDRRCAAAEADVEPAAAHLIEHADFLDHAERMIERQRVDHRPEAKPLGALRDRGEKHARRRRHAERRRVVLGQVIGVEARAIEQLDDREPLLVIVRQRRAGCDRGGRRFRIPSRATLYQRNHGQPAKRSRWRAQASASPRVGQERNDEDRRIIGSRSAGPRTMRISLSSGWRCCARARRIRPRSASASSRACKTFRCANRGPASTVRQPGFRDQVRGRSVRFPRALRARRCLRDRPPCRRRRFDPGCRDGK